MISLRTKYAFHFGVILALIHIAQSLPALVISFPGFGEEMSRIDPIQSVVQQGDTFTVLHDETEEIDGKLWSRDNVEKFLPMFRKRNLEHLAKSSGGYLKRIDNENHNKDKNKEQITKIIAEIFGKHKRGVQSLAKNRDFPRKNYQPKMKEVSLGSYTYIQKGYDARY